MADAGGESAALTVVSPMSGWLWPLVATPDAAFSQELVGPGVAIDPLSSTVAAPIGGRVVTFNASHHAVVIRHDCGIEVMVHVGIDTVALGGRGFVPRVREGDVVAAGDALLDCDLDAVAAAGKSLVSPVVVVAPDGAALTMLAEAGAIAAGDALYAVRVGVASVADGALGERRSAEVTIGLTHGVHARPAAALARLAREAGLAGTLAAGEREADVTSVVALMRLGLGFGDRATVSVSGAGADGALSRLLALLAGDFAESGERRGVAAVAASAAPGVLAGLCGSPGVAIGPGFRHRAQAFAFPERGDGVAVERARLAEALAQALAALASTGGTAGEVFAAHRELLLDPELRARAEAALADGASAGHAWADAARAVGEGFAAAGGWLAERQADLRDVSGRVLAGLAGGAAALPVPPSGAVVLAHDLLPSELAHYAGHGVVGVALAGSSPTAHVAIIAAGLGLPLLTGLGAGLEAVAEGAVLLLDAGAGTLAVDPDHASLGDARARIGERAAADRQAREAAQAPAVTRDGTAIAVMANLGGVADAEAAFANGADGCGLLRTEFLFLDRDAAPGEDEQVAAYRAVIAALDGRPVTIRTLDIGGDKPARFLSLGDEANPALGVRGVRVSLAWPALLATQLRAALRAAEGATVEVMVPMVADRGEWRQVRAAAEAAAAALGTPLAVKLGMMVETPAAVLLADQLAREADFLSIGTNDLTQYVLAMDRTNEALAAAADPLHPAVLRAIAAVCAAGKAAGCPVSVCGGLAADTLAVPVLIGLGVGRLSVPPGLVPAIKQAVRGVDRADGAALARRAMELATAADVRALLGEKGQ
ncbi:MAG: phosphoenolpyruvate--protein phosphotransferase [Sphingomonadales bacterium]|nr:phosphoenolpyruvate--protein phosphotransferase [Sphingomonadales bacterium]